MSNDVVRYDEKWAADAEQYASEETTSGMWISTRAGTLSFDDEELPGNQMCVVILDAVRENTYYEGDYDPDNMSPPVCYAMAHKDPDMAPHPSMQSHEWFEPQAAECSECPHAEWGSSPKGRGKACQNRRRLAVLPAGYFVPRKGSRDMDLEIFDDPGHYASADMAFLKLPVLSVKEWAKYVTQLSASLRRPPYAVITRVYLEPDAKAQFKVKFELVGELPEEMVDVIMARHAEAKENIMQGYQGPREDDEKSVKGGIKGLRK